MKAFLVILIKIFRRASWGIGSGEAVSSVMVRQRRISSQRLRKPRQPTPHQQLLVSNQMLGVVYCPRALAPFRILPNKTPQMKTACHDLKKRREQFFRSCKSAFFLSIEK
jgi:hypothetical protein